MYGAIVCIVDEEDEVIFTKYTIRSIDNKRCWIFIVDVESLYRHQTSLYDRCMQHTYPLAYTLFVSTARGLIDSQLPTIVVIDMLCITCDIAS